MITTTKQRQQPAHALRPSPVADIIERHRAEIREIWARHARELAEMRQQGRAA